MEIEKEVKKMTLGHEIGAGAACLKCKDKCEGFELHFWRKICRNCKCGIEDHDVQLHTEENQKVGRLFEDTKYTSLIAKLKRDGVPSFHGNQLTITISSPASGTALPFQVAGTAGVVSPAYSQGAPGAPSAPGHGAPSLPGHSGPFVPSAPSVPGYGTPSVSGNYASSVPGQGAPSVPHKGASSAPGHGAPSVPGHGAPSAPGHGAPSAPGHGVPSAPGHGVPSAPGHGAPSAPGHGVPSAPGHGAPSAPGHGAPSAPGHGAPSAPGHGAPSAPGHGAPSAPGHGAPSAPGHGAPSVPHKGAPSAAGQGVPSVSGASVAAGHGIPSAAPVAAAAVTPAAVAAQKDVVRAVTYEWAPPGVDQNLALRYMELLPPERRPIAGTQGADYRKKQMAKQLPEHDQDPERCHELSPAEVKQMQQYVRKYKDEALGIGDLTLPEELGSHTGLLQGAGSGDNQGTATMGKVGIPGAVESGSEAGPAGNFACHHCQRVMARGEPAVYAERAGFHKLWHPACFVCCTCNELLVDMIYFWKKGKVYCGRHYGDSEKPRCAGCDELIFSNEYTQAEGHDWHLKHFCCFDCDCVLAGETYVMEKDKPVCQPCYMKNHAMSCMSCEKPIEPEAQRVSYGEQHWHAEPECFRCAGCARCLVNQRFMALQGKLLCSVECKKKILTS